MVIRNLLIPAWVLVATLHAAPVQGQLPEKTPTEVEKSQPESSPAGQPPSFFENRLERELGIAGGLTAEQVAKNAISTSYSLEARRAEVLAAAADLDRARAAYFPRLTLLGRYTRLSDTNTGGGFSLVTAPEVQSGPIPDGTELTSVPLSFDSPLNNYLFQASLTVPVSDYFLRVSKNQKSAQLTEAASRKDLATSARRTAADAKAAYYDWVRTRLAAVVSEQALLDARAHREDVRNALGVGSASRADLLAIEARVADSERVLDSTNNLAFRLEEELRILRHDPSTTRYAIGEKLGEEPPLDVPSQVPNLVGLALSRRPELEALRLQARSLEHGAKAERASALPRLDLFGNAQYENPSRRVLPQQDKFAGSWDAGVQLSWTPSDIPGSSAQVSRLMANARALDAERRATEDQIRREVIGAHTALLDARAAIRTSARSLEAAEESYRVRRLLFQNGRATSVELMDAELELTRARLQAVGARIDLRIARVRLDYAVGKPAEAPSNRD